MTWKRRQTHKAFIIAIPQKFGRRVSLKGNARLIWKLNWNGTCDDGRGRECLRVWFMLSRRRSMIDQKEPNRDRMGIGSKSLVWDEKFSWDDRVLWFGEKELIGNGMSSKNGTWSSNWRHTWVLSCFDRSLCTSRRRFRRRSHGVPGGMHGICEPEITGELFPRFFRLFVRIFSWHQMQRVSSLWSPMAWFPKREPLCDHETFELNPRLVNGFRKHKCFRFLI